MIGDRYLEFGGLAGKYGINTGERNFKADEVALTLVHRHKTDADKQKRQNKGKIVVVVHRSQQHRKGHQAENEANAGW